jgi:hypothetical protein
MPRKPRCCMCRRWSTSHRSPDSRQYHSTRRRSTWGCLRSRRCGSCRTAGTPPRGKSRSRRSTASREGNSGCSDHRSTSQLCIGAPSDSMRRANLRCYHTVDTGCRSTCRRSGKSPRQSGTCLFADRSSHRNCRRSRSHNMVRPQSRNVPRQRHLPTRHWRPMRLRSCPLRRLLVSRAGHRRPLPRNRRRNLALVPSGPLRLHPRRSATNHRSRPSTSPRARRIHCYSSPRMPRHRPYRLDRTG